MMCAKIKRCPWAGMNPLYQQYHDAEWGVPVHDDPTLFEFLILEGAQAGLSWITVLKKRDNYRKAYDGFDPEKMACWTPAKKAQLKLDAGIIRNRLKIEAACLNAQAYLKIVEQCGSFDSYLWGFVDGRPINNAWKSMSEVPASTKVSDRMSKALKQQGFKFAGSTICYALMQAVGMVNDHLTTCFRYKEIQQL